MTRHAFTKARRCRKGHIIDGKKCNVCLVRSPDREKNKRANKLGRRLLRLQSWGNKKAAQIVTWLDEVES